MSYTSIKNNLLIFTILFCLIQLSGCSFSNKYSSSRDGAPRGDFDASKIPDAVPKNEPRNLRCNRPYVAHGHKYYVLKSSNGYNKIGTASWYGTKFHGRRTSSSEPYNLYSMTAASPILPIPTYAQVTNLSNGRQVIVKVNDRGPFRGNRLIDVSYAAAKKLGFSGSGTAKVQVVAIDPNNWHPNQINRNKKPSDYPLLAKNDLKLNPHPELKTKQSSQNYNNSNSPGSNKQRALNQENVAYGRRNDSPNKKLSSLQTSSQNVGAIDSNRLSSANAAATQKATGIYVQVGSFYKLDNAQKLSAKIGQLMTTPTLINRKTHNQKSVYEVHVGPLANATQSKLIKQLLESNGLGKAAIINS